MSISYNFGQEAEKHSADYFRSLGFQILERNYRYRKAEVDLIVQKDGLLVAVEVKARSSAYFGDPQSFVSKKKIQLLVMAIDAYIQQRNLDVEVRFDVISILKKNNALEIQHIENAFYHFWI